MAAQEIKQKIYKVLDNMPDEVLEDVYKYLESLKSRSRTEITISQNLARILQEDKNLLERLAQ
jgi:hypothetical protein